MDTKTHTIKGMSEGAVVVQALCEFMKTIPAYEFSDMGKILETVGEKFPEYASFLAQKPADVMVRYKMSKEACKAPSRC